MSSRPAFEVEKVCATFSKTFHWSAGAARAAGIPFILLEPLQTTTEAIYFAALDTTNGASYKLKFIDLLDEDEAARQRAMNEVECRRRCDSFALVKCHELFIERDRRNSSVVTAVAFVLDDLQPWSLRADVQVRTALLPLKYKSAISVFMPLLIGVHHLHAHQILHGDIKIDNIFSDRHGWVVKLGGLAACKHYSTPVSNNVCTQFEGTNFHYMAPEIWLKLSYNCKADVFSLGVILYELITGKLPFDGRNRHEIMRSTQKGFYAPLPESVNAHLAGLVAQLLEGNPLTRPSTVDALRHPLCLLWLTRLFEGKSSYQKHLSISDYRCMREEVAELLAALAQPDMPLPGAPRPFAWDNYNYDDNLLLLDKAPRWQSVKLHICLDKPLRNGLPNVQSVCNDGSCGATLRPCPKLVLRSREMTAQSDVRVLYFRDILHIIPANIRLAKRKAGSTLVLIHRDATSTTLVLKNAVECERMIDLLREVTRWTRECVQFEK